MTDSRQSLMDLAIGLEERALLASDLRHALEPLVDEQRWDEVIAGLEVLGTAVRDTRSTQLVWEELAGVLGLAAAVSEEGEAAGELFARRADILARHLRRRGDAVAALLDAFRACPDVQWLDRLEALLGESLPPSLQRAALGVRARLGATAAHRALAQSELAQLELKAGRLTQAEELIQAALRTDPENATALDGRSKLDALQGARAQRVDALRAAADRAADPEERARALVRLGDALWERRGESPGAAAEALDAWCQSLRVVPLVTTVDRLVQRAADLPSPSALVEVLRDAIELTADRPTLHRLHRELAQLALEGANPDPARALEHLEAARAAEPWEHTTLEQLAELYRRNELWEPLVSVLEQLRVQLRQPDAALELLREIGRLRWQELGDWEGAEASFRRLRAHAPHDPEVLQFYELYAVERQDWLRLYAVYEARFDAAAPNERKLWAQRMAELAQEQGPSLGAKAVEAWRRLLEVDPENGDALSAMEAALVASGKWHALAEHLQRQARRAEERSDVGGQIGALEKLADLYTRPERLPLPEMVVETYRRLLALDPARIDALDALAARYEQLGRWSDLSEVLEARLAHTLVDEDALALRRRLAALWLRRGDLDRALPFVEAIVERDPSDLAHLRQLQQIYRRQASWLSLYRALQAELDLEAENERFALLVDLAVLAQEKLGEPDSAIVWWEQAQQCDPRASAPRAALEALYAETEQWRELAALLEARVAAAPNRHSRVELLERLAAVVRDHLGDKERAAGLEAELAELRPFGGTQGKQRLERATASQTWADLEAQGADKAEWRAYARALEDATRATTDDSLLSELFFELARVAETKLEEPGRAAKALERVLALDPAHTSALRRLLAIALERGPDERAYALRTDLIAQLTDSAERLPLIDAQAELASALGLAAERVEWAARAFEERAELGDEVDPERLAETACDAGHPERAVEALSAAAAALTAAPHLQVRCLVTLGLLLKTLGRNDDARVRLEDALALDSHNETALAALQELALAGADWPALAATLWRRVAAHQGLAESRPYLVQLGELYESFFDDPDRAIEVYEGLRALDPADAEATDGLRRVYSNFGRTAELIALLTSEAERASTAELRAEWTVELAQVHAQTGGNSEVAAELAVRALALAPQSASAVAVLEVVLDRAAPIAAPALEGHYRRTQDGPGLLRALEKQLGLGDVEQQRGRKSEIAQLLPASPEGDARALALYLDLAASRPDDLAAWDGAEARRGHPGGLAAVCAALAQATGVGASSLEPAAAPVADEGLRANLLWRQARLATEAGEQRTALEAYEELLGYVPHDTEALAAAAALYRSLGHTDLWLIVQRKRADLASDPAERLDLLTQGFEVLAGALDQPAEAARWGEEIAAMQPDRELFARLASLYERAGNAAGRADALRRRAVGLQDPLEASRIYGELGAVLALELDDPNEAAASLEKAILLDEAAIDALRTLTDLLQSPSALRVETSLLERAHMTAQAALERQGLGAEALQLEEHRAQRTENPVTRARIRCALAQRAAALHDPSRAFDLAAAALNDDPSSSAARELLAALAATAGRAEDALPLLERSAREAPLADRRAAWLLVARLAAEPLGLWDVVGRALEGAAAGPPVDTELLTKALDAWAAAENPQAQLLCLDKLINSTRGAERASFMLQAAQLARGNGDAKRAAELLEPVAAEAQASPQAEEALRTLASLYEELGQTTDQLRVLDQLAPLISAPQERAAVLRVSAQIASQEGHTERAISLLEQAVDADPSALDTAWELERRLWELQDIARLRALYSLLRLRVAKANGEALLRQGNAEWELARNPQEAVLALSLALQVPEVESAARGALLRIAEEASFPSGYHAIEALLRHLESKGDHDGLEGAHNMALTRFGSAVDPRPHWRALAELCAGPLADPAGAFHARLALFELDPQSHDAWAALTEATTEPDHFSTVADSVLARELQLPQVAALELLERAGAWLNDAAPDPEVASEVWQTLLRHDPRAISALDALQALYGGRGDWGRLAETLALRAEAEDEAGAVAALYQLGALQQSELGQEEAALATYERILALDPHEADAYEQMAGILDRRSEVSRLDALLVRWLELPPPPPVAAAALRRRLLLLEGPLANPELAVDTARQLLALEPTDAIAAAYLQRAQASGELTDDSRVLLERSAEARGDTATLVALLRQRAETAERDDKLRLLERAADAAERKLQDPALDTELRGALFTEDPSAGRLERLARTAATAGAWGRFSAIVDTATAHLPGGEAAALLHAAALHIDAAQGPCPESAQLHERAFERAPAEPELLRALEASFRALGRKAELVFALELAAVEASSGERKAELYGRAAAVALDELEDAQSGVELLRRAVAAHPGALDARKRLESLFIKRGAFEELDALYRDALAGPLPATAQAETAFKLAFLLAEKRQDAAIAVHWLGHALAVDPRYRPAIRFLESLLTKLGAEDRLPNGEPARRLAAELLLAGYGDDTPTQSWLAAAQARMEFATSDAELARALVSVGEVLRDRLGDSEGAFQRFSTALRLAPEWRDVALALERTAERVDTLEQLVELYIEVSDLHPDHRAHYVERAAAIAERLGRADQALALWERVAHIDPTSTAALAGLERLARIRGDRSAVRALLVRRAALTSAPAELAELWARVGAIAEEAGHAEDAAAAYAKSLAADASQLSVSERLESLYHRLERWTDLAALMDAHLSHLQDPEQRTELLTKLAQLYERQLGRLAEAAACYREIFDLNPNSIYAIAGLERLCPRVGDWEALASVLQRKRDLLASPTDRNAVELRLGEIFHRHIGDLEVALDYYRMVLGRDERNAAALAGVEELALVEALRIPASLALEEVFERTGQWPRLMELCRKQVPLASNDDERWELLSRVADLARDRVGRPLEAIEALAESLRYDVPVEEAFAGLTELGERTRRFDAVVAAVAPVHEAISDTERGATVGFWLATVIERRLGDTDAAIRRYQDLLGAPTVRERAGAALEGLLQTAGRFRELYETLASLVEGAAPEQQRLLRLRLADVAEAQLDDATAALQWLKEILAASPTDREAQERLERLAEGDPDLRPAVLEALAPLYRDEGRWVALARLVDLQLAAARDAAERSDAALAVADIYAEKLQEPRKALDRYLLVLVEDARRGLDWIDVALDLARGLGRETDVATAAQNGAARTLDADVRARLLWRAADIWQGPAPDPDKAERVLRTLLDDDPSRVVAYDRLEQLYNARGRKDDLFRLLERKARLPLPWSDKERALRDLAVAAEAVGELGPAIDALEQVLAVKADDREATIALERLLSASGDGFRLANALERQIRALPAHAPEGAALKLKLAALRVTERNDLEGAIALYEQVLQAEPARAEALSALERLYIETSQWERLCDTLERQAVHAATPVAAAEYYRRAATLSENELANPDEAARYLDAILAVQPNDTAALDELIRVLHMHGRWAALASAYERKITALGPRGDKLALQVKLSEVLADKLGDASRAEPVVNEVLNRHPGLPAGLLVLARVREGQGRWPEAIEILEGLLSGTTAQVQRQGVLLRLGGMLLDRAKDVQRAQRVLSDLVAADPAHREGNELLRRALASAGNWAALVEVLKRQVNWVESTGAKAEKLREIAGIYHQHLGDSATAAVWLEQALRLDPEDEATMRALLAAVGNRGKPEVVEPILRAMVQRLEAQRRFADLPKYAHQLGRLQERQGDAAEAEQLYRLAYRHDATYLPNLLSLGRLLLAREDYSQAMAMYQAMQLQQHNAPDTVKLEIFFTLGLISEKLEDPKRAKQYYQRASRIDRHHGPTAEALARLGD